MEVKDGQYEFNFANKSKEERLAELYNLKRIYEQAKGNIDNQNNNTDYRNYNTNESDISSQNSATNSYQRVLSTGVGRAMTENNRQGGFSNALMLGIISFVFEILFLAVAIFIYK